MEHISDPPTAGQVGQILERLNNLVDDVRDVKHKQDETNTMLVAIANVQTNLSHVGATVHNLAATLEKRTDEMAVNDKRITLLERWRLGLVALAMVAIGGIGWAFQRIDAVTEMETHLTQLDTRLGTLELIVNSHHIENAMSPDAPLTTPRK